MNKLCLVLSTVSICAAGCTTSYTVHVNGFSEFEEPIKEKASIYVAVDANSQNPIFDKEIKARIEMLLKSRGYIPAPDVEQAEYRLVFQVGLDSHGVTSYTPFYHPYSGFYNRYWGNYDLGYTRYVPYFETFYDQWLIMKVFDAGFADALENGKVVWIGEAMISTDAADLRQIVNYLLVAGFEYFGVDTNRQITLAIGPDDPRIIQISSLR
jgi:hypothetical protein